jgi:osmoprotectant transport system permease protein
MNDFQGTWSWLTTLANWQGEDGVWNRLLEHLALTAAGVGLACLLVLPLALFLGHVGRGGTLAINITNVGRAIPVYAILVIFVLGPLGATTKAIVLALALFAIPPIMTNTYVGVREVDRGVVDAARGAGMTGFQILRRVELPLATPLIMNGVRLATVQVVATATIAALVAGGGLGRIITQGFADQNVPELVGGAIVVAVLALVLEGVFSLLQRVTGTEGRARGIRRTGRRLAKSTDLVVE